jgi:large subunit ribosomal protein L9
MATTQVILTEKIETLGAEADVVKVRAGYARNFLIPTGKALEVTPVTLRRINLLKAKRAEREARELNEAQDLAKKINKIKLSLELETGETGKAFGSITNADLSEHLRKQLGGNTVVDRHRIQLDRPIKESGEHEVVVKLHSDVTATFVVNVKAKGGEVAEEAAADDDRRSRGGYKAKAKARHKSADGE